MMKRAIMKEYNFMFDYFFGIYGCYYYWDCGNNVGYVYACFDY